MKKLLAITVAGVLPLVASAQLFTEDFDTDSTAEWSFNSSVAGDGATDDAGNEANFFFDYGTVGIPSAPNSTGGSTIGLKMEANVFGTNTPVFSGMSASPTGQSFTGDYTLTFDAWQNVNGPLPAGGSGSTQLTLGGIGSGDTTTQFIGGTFTGVGFAATGEGGSASDYRAYIGPGAAVTTAGTYAAGSQNNSNAYYGVFGSNAVPAAQTAYATSIGSTSQTGSTQTGALGMAWRTWTIDKVGGTVTWSVDGTLIATLTNTEAELTGTNIFLGYSDTNGTASTDAFSRQFLFGLVDNVQVTGAPVPEPGTIAALSIGALALLRRRRQR